MLSDETDVFDGMFHLDGQRRLLMDGRPLFDSAIITSVLLTGSAILSCRHSGGQWRRRSG